MKESKWVYVTQSPRFKETLEWKHAYISVMTLLRVTTSIRSNFFVYFIRKNLLFLFYTSTFTKPHHFIYSIHLFNKIFIFLQFFIIPSLTAPLSHRSTIHHYQRLLHTQPPSSPSSHHHHHPTSIIKENQSAQSQTHSSPTQPET